MRKMVQTRESACKRNETDACTTKDTNSWNVCPNERWWYVRKWDIVNATVYCQPLALICLYSRPWLIRNVSSKKLKQNAKTKNNNKKKRSWAHEIYKRIGRSDELKPFEVIHNAYSTEWQLIMYLWKRMADAVENISRFCIRISAFVHSSIRSFKFSFRTLIPKFN